LATLVMALAALLALVLIDARLSPLPLALRWTLTISWFAIAAGTALVAWLLPMRRPLELLKIARWLEIRHPELDERISTAMELSGSGGGGVSQSLLAELSRAALSDLAGIDPRTGWCRRWDCWPAGSHCSASRRIGRHAMSSARCLPIRGSATRRNR
jgi:hypothetical protein